MYGNFTPIIFLGDNNWNGLNKINKSYNFHLGRVKKNRVDFSTWMEQWLAEFIFDLIFLSAAKTAQEVQMSVSPSVRLSALVLNA